LTPGPSEEGGFPLLRLFVSSLACRAAFSVRKVAISPSSALIQAVRLSTWATTALSSVATASGPCR